MSKETSKENTKMTQEEAIAYIADRMEQKGISQASMANELGISSSALSSWMNLKYKSPQNITDKVCEIKKLAESKQLAPKAPSFSPTTVTDEVTQAIAYAHARGVVSVSYGDAGVGKTTAVEQYLKSHSLAIGCYS